MRRNWTVGGQRYRWRDWFAR